MKHHISVIGGRFMPSRKQRSLFQPGHCFCEKIVLLLFLIMAGCQTLLLAQVKKNVLRGLVENYKGEPLANVSVELSDEKASIRRYAITGENGFFQIDNSGLGGLIN